MDPRKPMLVHNFILFALSFYMGVECLRQAFFVNKYTLWGNGVDNSDAGLGMAQIVWIFYLSKILEFGDTVRAHARIIDCLLAVSTQSVSMGHHVYLC